MTRVFARASIALAAALALLGGALGGPPGAAVGLAVVAVPVWWLWTEVGRRALREIEGREVGPRDAPALVGEVAWLAGRAGLPMPRVFLVADDQPNAFATGRDPAGAAIIVHQGLLALPREERLGVLAHEMAHIARRDTFAVAASAIVLGAMANASRRKAAKRKVSRPVAWAARVLAPFVVGLVQMAISRNCELEADRLGARICGNPLWLAAALCRLASADAGADPGPAWPFVSFRIARPWFLSTHPDVDGRIDALVRMARRSDNWSRSPEGASAWSVIRGCVVALHAFAGGCWAAPRRARG